MNSGFRPARPIDLCQRLGATGHRGGEDFQCRLQSLGKGGERGPGS